MDNQENRRDQHGALARPLPRGAASFGNSVTVAWDQPGEPDWDSIAGLLVRLPDRMFTGDVDFSSPSLRFTIARDAFDTRAELLAVLRNRSREASNNG